MMSFWRTVLGMMIVTRYMIVIASHAKVSFQSTWCHNLLADKPIPEKSVMCVYDWSSKSTLAHNASTLLSLSWCCLFVQSLAAGIGHCSLLYTLSHSSSCSRCMPLQEYIVIYVSQCSGTLASIIVYSLAMRIGKAACQWMSHWKNITCWWLMIMQDSIPSMKIIHHK